MNDYLTILKDKFGYDEFRYNQEEIIKNIMEGNDIIATLKTGGGKSICFQIPAILKEGITLVITPLISLMEDQVMALKEKRIKAAYLNSSLDIKEEQAILYDIKKYKLLYVSPERLTNEYFIRRISKVKISLLVIDEAHCITLWGHDFRNAYLLIKNFIDRFNYHIQIALFSATISNKVLLDIVKVLDIKNPLIITLNQDRKDLYYAVFRNKDKYKYVTKFLLSHKEEKTLIYALTRKKVEEISLYLNGLNIKNGYYHGGMETQEKEESYSAFKEEKIKVLVATNAFGMGIDIRDIRNIILFEPTLNLEELAQQFGRASRDMQGGSCIMLYDDKDLKTLEYFIHKTEDKKQQKMMYKDLDKVVEFAYSKKCLHYLLAKEFYSVKEYKCNNCINCKRK